MTAALDELLAPPDDATVEAALQDYAELVRTAYGKRLRGLYLFGSRARGDHKPDSDADVAVVLADGDWKAWEERFRLSDLGYDILVDTGADIQGWPVRETEWRHPERHENPSLVKAMRRDARRVTESI